MSSAKDIPTDLTTYAAEIRFFDADTSTPCKCSNCDAELTAGQLDAITDCILTPGDASPAGRCPHCGSLAYLNRPKDQAAEHATELLDACKALLDAQSKPRHPLGAPDEGIATLCVEAASKARNAIAKAGG